MTAETDHIEVVRLRLRVEGRVQGVGFRPYVYRLASAHGLFGFARNAAEGVTIEIEGPPDRVIGFCARLPVDIPQAARIARIQSERVAPIGDGGFRITPSEASVPQSTLATAQITPDLAICPDCLAELRDPADRRHGYAFLNCTNCGPRFTIVRGIPYDRVRTSMSVFEQCPDCAREYARPADRRYHAQPNACPVCGPRLRLAGVDGETLPGADPVAGAANLLRAGKVVAVRGLGGFHLAVDPFDDLAVATLRDRKRRVGKPFALMAAELEVVRRHCHVSSEEERLLQGPERPVVLLRARERDGGRGGGRFGGRDGGLSPSVAPGRRELGFMLAYTPLHHLLLDAVGSPLVMTSANRADEPIVTGNREALERLAGLADAFLLHDREILQRNDDSVFRVVRTRPQAVRRSRGYVPGAIPLPVTAPLPILAVGGELKNTVTLVRGDSAFPSQHIGDLDHPAAAGFFDETIELLGRVLEIRPRVVAHDLHPDYRSTRWALDRPWMRPVAVQHHHAHLASVLAEHGRTQPAVGIILDGTGYGTDGTIWGGEILVGDLRSFRRHAWLRPFPLPGGDAAARQGWRSAMSLLVEAYGPGGLLIELPGLATIDRRTREGIGLMLERRINSPVTSSAGRLFDAVSALCGICLESTYEGEAAILLEAAADEDADPWSVAQDNAAPAGCDAAAAHGAPAGSLDIRPIVRAVVNDLQAGTAPAVVSSRFHATLAALVADAAIGALGPGISNTIVLSGGVFQNARLDRLVTARLESRGIEVLRNEQVPPNDGGISYGQAAIAAAVLAHES